jgi:CheY-like chemotaxis protein
MTSNILFIEDDLTQESAIKAYYRQDVRQGNYKLLIAHSGEEAIHILEEDEDLSIDIIVTDLKMPGAQIDGWDLVKLLAAQNIKIKTIVYTAYGSEKDFTQEENENIMFFLNREEANLAFLKQLINLALKLPEKIDKQTSKVNYVTLLKLVKGLPSKIQKKLIEQTVEYLDYKTLVKLKETIVEKIDSNLKTAFARDKLKKWMLLKQEEGILDKNIPLRKIAHFLLEARLHPNGTYYYWIRWWEDGKIRGKYIPKDLAESLPLECKICLHYPKK